MSEFQEVMKEWHRLCKSRKYCEDCPLGWQCQCLLPINRDNVDYNGGEETIMKWAAEHPEPVYPTWQEWFVMRGDMPEGYRNATNPSYLIAQMRRALDKQIPADIAEKLGLKPKE